MTKKIRIITHSAGFHADDVFGVATLSLLLGKENIEVIRTRDPQIIATGDYVLDVGSVYDAEKNKFDHHQRGGAAVRENGIPYASFGLIWKKFGVEVAGSQGVADLIDRDFAQPIDAFDNGVVLYELTHPSKIHPLHLQSTLFLFESARGETPNQDEAFLEAVAFARRLLERKIVHTKAEEEVATIVRSKYQDAPDKRLVLIDVRPTVPRVPTTSILSEYPEPMFFVRQHENGNWQAVAVSVNPENSFEKRKSFPESWAGKIGEDFAVASGVSDALFCHNGRFMVVAVSKESAIKLAELALEA